MSMLVELRALAETLLGFPLGAVKGANYQKMQLQIMYIPDDSVVTVRFVE